MRFIYLFLLPLFLFFSRSSMAQTELGFRLWSPQFSKFTSAVTFDEAQPDAKYSSASLTGLLIGPTARIHFKEHPKCSIMVEFLYSIRGNRSTYRTGQLNGYTITSIPSMNQSYIEYYFDVRMNYFEIPVLFGYNVSPSKDAHVWIGGGGSVAINAVSKIKYNQFSIKSPGSFFSSIDESVTDIELNKANLFMINSIVDIECEFRLHKKMHYLVYVRYNYGLTPVFQNQFQKLNTHLSTIGFGVAMRWGYVWD